MTMFQKSNFFEYEMLLIASLLSSWGCSLLSSGSSSDDVDDGNYTRPPLVYCDNPGEPCEDNNPCTINPTCVGGVCFGQMMACKEGQECPDTACPFYYSSDRGTGGDRNASKSPNLTG